ncbi:MAG: S-methyl-5'-thioadenosine phosphorylase [Candidatus Wallbacteria bacterium HGW-Wallbacteria-1]|jgi:5'-methylthioadenosine phosphorylase|uniref:S-methyl-5'-thioadenosine phosphorylase n=1 Tax=Candidatus Wallbacteria bacterium HGW-Wallbacteria-1 TaxID=2013854 RepID=A0A2N1PS44_9BACT|nr:MAG: S-methyl-5'-thioadenosine phosphorylase [Candidatus Wallbacteria bacterium HGW-Wallbacteria-1]
MNLEHSAVVGFIGGSGLYDIEGFEDVTMIDMETPFGTPSDRIAVGTLRGIRVAFLPRHGRGHRFSPSEINYRANIWAMKRLGVRYLVSISAVGSLREELEPAHFLIPDGLVDWTRQRAGSFYGDGAVGHVSMADPYCRSLSEIVAGVCSSAGAEVHLGGTYICIEGPQFSTRAESKLYRSWGMDIIGMTNAQESKLSREAGICFSTIALITDYDVWHQAEDVSVEAVLRTLARNIATVKSAVAGLCETVAALDDGEKCSCCAGVSECIMTADDMITSDAAARLEIFRT